MDPIVLIGNHSPIRQNWSIPTLKMHTHDYRWNTTCQYVPGLSHLQGDVLATCWCMLQSEAPEAIMHASSAKITAACLMIIRASGFLPAPAAHVVGLRSPAIAPPGRMKSTSELDDPHLTAVEFFSGIGGLRVSMEKAMGDENLKTHVKSFDINSVANLVHEHNFPGSSVTRRSIEHLSAEDLDAVADAWLLSPPCQPFCRIGKQMDEDDPRTVSFVHLLSLLRDLENPPSRIFLENVVGFEGSKAHQRLLEVLILRGFVVEQFLLSPMDLGVPNTRVRYYCLASRQNAEGEGEVAAIKKTLPQDPSTAAGHPEGRGLRPLREFLDPSLNGEATVPLLLSQKAASHATPSLRFDVVTSRSTETTTFTKGYGKHAGRAGPIILLTADGERRVSEENLGRFPAGLKVGPEGRELRWFSDREMLTLHGFPQGFGFPASVTLRQRFALIGNSVNVEVVALLLRRLLLRDRLQAGEPRVETDVAAGSVRH